MKFIREEREPDYQEFKGKVNDLCAEYGFIISVNRHTSHGRLIVLDAATGTEMTHEYDPIRFAPQEARERAPR